MKDLKKFYLFIYMSVCMFNAIVEAIPPQTLNISDVSKDSCSFVDKVKINGIILTTYLAYDHDNIRRVMDSSSLIWDSEDSGKILRLCRTYVLNNKPLLSYIFFVDDGKIHSRYYQKRGYEWFEVTISEFGALLHRLETERSFDIRDKPDETIFTHEKHNFFGIPATVIVPSKSIILTTITDDSDIIWKSQDDCQNCTSVIVHGHPNKPQLVHINIKKSLHLEEMYFYKNGNLWVATTKSYFYEKLDELDNIEEKRKARELQNERE